jgi:hypothetical protein
VSLSGLDSIKVSPVVTWAAGSVRHSFYSNVQLVCQRFSGQMLQKSCRLNRGSALSLMPGQSLQLLKSQPSGPL